MFLRETKGSIIDFRDKSIYFRLNCAKQDLILLFGFEHFHLQSYFHCRGTVVQLILTVGHLVLV